VIAALRPIATALIALAFAAAAHADATNGSVIGGFAEVANKVSGAMPGQSPAPKQVKSPAHFGEHVLTGAGSRATIMFIDKSHLLVGEKSEVTIDAFVFDPKSGAEQATYNLAAGALRFVSGAIKGDNLKIETPTAVVAVRGTNLKIRVLANGNTVIAVNRGRVDVTSRRNGETASLGAGQSVDADNGGLGDVQSSEADVGDTFVDEAALDGAPDLADVGLADLGFSPEDAADIDAAVDQAASEDGSDGSDNSGDSGDNGSSEGGSSEGGNSDSGGNDSGGGDGGGDHGGGD
jgi:uncharacterized membrane protein YgcG